jgi:putative thioredoxin
MFGKTPPATPTAAAAGGAQGDIIKDTSTAGFAKDVLEASRSVPVLVHFTSERSAACKQLTPMLAKLVRAQNGKVRLVRMDVDKHPTIAQQLRVQALPTVYAFLDGRPVDGFAGPQSEAQVKAVIERLAGEAGADDITEALAAAQQAVDAGDLQAAAEVYAAVLQQDAQHPAALAGLATCYMKTGDFERAEQTLGLVPPDKQSMAAVAQVKAALAIARLGASAGDTAALEARIAADPKNHEARIDLAKAFAAGGRKQEALDQLLESIRRDRKWNDEAARKQLVQFFDAWGAKDPLTLEGRRRLSSILFS